MRQWANIDKELTEDFREQLYASIFDYQVRVRRSGRAKAAAAATASNGANAYPYDMGDSAAAEMATNGANALDECVVGSYEVVDDGAIYVGRQLDLLNY